MSDRPLSDRIEALVWSVENRMVTHDDVVALDAIKLEAETLEAQCADLEDIVRVHGIREDQLEAERDCLRAKVERLERAIFHMRDAWDALPDTIVRYVPLDVIRSVQKANAALEGRGP